MAVYDYFPHNWANNVTMSTEWTTQVDVSESRLAETRRCLVPYPRRTIAVRWSGLDKAAATVLLFELVRSGSGDRRIPLYQDQAETTATSSGTTINCPTDYRRFYVGGMVLISSEDGTSAEWATIQSLTSSALTLSSGLTGSFAAGSRVFPVAIVDALLDAQIELLTDQKAQVTAEFAESTTRLPAAGEWADLASYGFSQIDSFAYLLGIEPEWSDGVVFSMSRPGRQALFDRVDKVVTWGPRPVLTMDLTYTFTTREEFWPFLQFFDAHRGRALPFWVENPLDMWDPVAVTTTSLDITAVGDLEDYTTFVKSIEGGSPFLLIHKTDGTKILSQITGVTSPSAGVFRLAATLPSMSLSDIQKASLAFFVRFSSDSLLETWSTDQVCRVTVSVVELLRWEDETSSASNDGFFTGGVAQLCD